MRDGYQEVDEANTVESIRYPLTKGTFFRGLSAGSFEGFFWDRCACQKERTEACDGSLHTSMISSSPTAGAGFMKAEKQVSL